MSSKKKYKSNKIKLNESNYNNIFFAPISADTYRTTFTTIRAISSYNNHTVDKRLGPEVRSDWKQLPDTFFAYIFVKPMPILLHINTNCKISIVDTFPLMDTILLSKIPVYTIIDSVCRDTMLLPFVVGKERYMYENAHIYFTTTFFESVGSSSIEDKMNNLTAIGKKILTIFKKYTKFPPEIYKDLFKRELFLNADDCLKYGIIDYII